MYLGEKREEENKQVKRWKKNHKQIQMSKELFHSMGNRWGNSRNSVRLYFGGLQITAGGDCSLEIKRCLLLGRKVMTNLDSIFKSRDITLPTKVHLVKAMVFSVVCVDVRVGL